MYICTAAAGGTDACAGTAAPAAAAACQVLKIVGWMVKQTKNREKANVVRFTQEILISK